MAEPIEDAKRTVANTLPEEVSAPSAPEDAGPAEVSHPHGRETHKEEADAARTVPHPGSPRALSTVGELPQFPGYEITIKIAHGGMGVVYRARDIRLNRQVALKVVKDFDSSNSHDLIRFLTEAESIAAIDHPHIVRVYEYGEHLGWPYLAMEYLAGGSLADRLKSSGRMDPGAAAALVAKIANGMQAAHDQGIVHRDLKPGNVMLDAAGEPKVTDFGLAKRGGNALTKTEAVMGTPPYMSPEQASGKTKLAGPPADIYALGVILYELLSGTTPFRGDDPWTVLRQVIEDEPETLLRRCPGTPRDLDLICRKCLAKTPAERYLTAAALATDLGNFLAGKPVDVRPVKTLDRGVKWVRRNPGLAGSIAAVALALILGSTVAIGFGLEAEKQAGLANDKSLSAQAASDRAGKAAAELEKVNDDLQRTNDDLNDALAKTLLGPITSDRRDAPLTAYEVESFWGLASRRGTGVGYRFLEEATRTPLTCRQLACRAENALHAAVGLDDELRRRSDNLLLRQLNRADLPDEQRFDLARVCARMESISPELAHRSAEVLIEALNKTTNPDALRDFTEALSSIVGRMAPPTAAAVLSEALANRQSAAARYALAEGLAAVAGRMSPNAATPICEKAATVLTEAMTTSEDAVDLRRLASGLAAVANRLEIRAATHSCTQAANQLTQAMSNSTDSFARVELATGLAAVANRMAPDQAAAILTKTMTVTDDSYALVELAAGLAAVARRLEPHLAVDMLTEAMLNSKGSFALRDLAVGLTEVATRMEPPAAAAKLNEATARLTTMPNAKKSIVLVELAKGLGTIARNMVDVEAAAVMLREAMIHTKDPAALVALASVLAEVAGRMEAHAAAATLSRAMTQNPSFALVELAAGLSAVARRMEPGPAAAALMQAMTDVHDSGARRRLAVGLALVEGNEGARACEAATTLLSAAMRDAHDAFVLRDLAEGLTAVAGRIDVPSAMRACDAAATTLTAAMTNTRDSFAVVALADGLTSVAIRLEADPAARARAKAVDILTDGMTNTRDAAALRELASGLAKVAVRMDPQNAASMLIEAITNTQGSAALAELAKGLAVVAGRMDAHKSAAMLTEALRNINTRDGAALRELATGLSSVARRIEPPTRAVAILTEAMSNTKDSTALAELAKGLAAIAEKMEPHQAVTMLMDTMTNSKDPLALREAMGELSKGLAAIARKMEAHQAAEMLAEAMTNTRGSVALAELAKGLATVAGKMEPRKAAITRIEAMANTKDPAILQDLAADLNATTLGLSRDPQALVDLLKHPFCVGRARQAVLGALAITYNRAFATRWEFVEYARQFQPQLDLLTPPKRTTR